MCLSVWGLLTSTPSTCLLLPHCQFMCFVVGRTSLSHSSWFLSSWVNFRIILSSTQKNKETYVNFDCKPIWRRINASMFIVFMLSVQKHTLSLFVQVFFSSPCYWFVHLYFRVCSIGDFQSPVFEFSKELLGMQKASEEHVQISNRVEILWSETIRKSTSGGVFTFSLTPNLCILHRRQESFPHISAFQFISTI